MARSDSNHQKSNGMKCIVFQFTSISIQVITDKDLCFIFSNGRPIWAGSKDELIELLKKV